MPATTREPSRPRPGRGERPAARQPGSCGLALAYGAWLRSNNGDHAAEAAARRASDRARAAGRRPLGRADRPRDGREHVLARRRPRTRAHLARSKPRDRETPRRQEHACARDGQQQLRRVLRRRSRGGARPGRGGARHRHGDQAAGPDRLGSAARRPGGERNRRSETAPELLSATRSSSCATADV